MVLGCYTGARGSVHGIVMDYYVSCIFVADSVLLFNVELLEVKHPSLLGSGTSTGLYSLLAGLLVIGLIGYELYKRYNTTDTSTTKSTKTTSNKKKKGKRR